MIRNMKAGVPSLFKGGTKHLTGVEAAVIRNIEVCQQLSAITRTSLGPNGMNKMVINHLEKLFVTNDAVTIMAQMEIVHAAAKMVVMAADMQEREIGDGSNLVVILAGELLKKAAELIEMGLHQSEIIKGYEVATEQLLKIMETLSIEEFEEKDLYDKEALTRGIKTAIAAKQYGYEDFLSPLVAEACMAVMPKNPANFIVDNVRVVKLMGSSLDQSCIFRGMVFGHGPLGSVKHVTGAKIVMFTCPLDVASTETKGNVLLHTAEELLNYSNSEEKSIEKQIKMIADSGANVIVTTGSVSDMAKHFINKYNLLLLKLGSQFNFRRLCRAVKAKPYVKLEPVHPDDLGFCSSVETREYGLTNVTVFSQDKNDDTAVATIMLRASTNNILSDLEKAVDDGVNVVKAMVKDARFVAGAGACEIEIAKQLRDFAETRSGLDQYALKAFSEAFEVVPRTLAENAGLDGTEIIADLYAAHENGDARAGIDILEGKVGDVSKDGVLDHLGTKLQAVKLSSNSAITILRVDQIIQRKRAGGPKAPKKQGHWDDQD